MKSLSRYHKQIADFVAKHFSGQKKPLGKIKDKLFLCLIIKHKHGKEIKILAEVLFGFPHNEFHARDSVFRTVMFSN